jgi:GT2 family glycosyltransferase
MSATPISELQDSCVYPAWRDGYEESCLNDNASVDASIERMAFRPRFAIAALSFRPFDESELEALNASLRAQSYGDWRLFLPFEPGGAASQRSSPPAPNPISALEQAVSWEEADFVVTLPFDCVLARHALAELALAINDRREASLFYVDEELRQGDGDGVTPWFKPDFDPFLALGRDLTGAFACYRHEALIPCLREPFRSSTIDNLSHELTLRFMSAWPRASVAHIPAALCRRAAASDWRADTAREAVRDYFLAAGRAEAGVSAAPLAPQWCRLHWPLPEPEPLVSIIIPTRDKAELIRQCVEGLLYRTDYRNFEILIVDNDSQDDEAIDVLDELASDSRVRVIRDARPFNFSALINEAAKAAKGEIFLLLNNDTDVLHGDWLTELVSLACLPEVGAAGAKLRYPDGSVQHAGVAFGPDNHVRHVFRFAERDDAGPRGELALLRQVSAVTAACLMVRRDVFEEAGGFDEEYAVAYQDIDFCRKVARRGYAILCTPHAELLHFEAASRCLHTSSCENFAREYGDMIRFWERNPEFYDRYDPFLSPNLTFGNGEMTFAKLPGWKPPWRIEQYSPRAFFY